MKNLLFLFVFVLNGLSAISQNVYKPDWFYNQDCKDVEKYISSIRTTPSDHDFSKYKMDSTNKSPLTIDYDLSELVSVHVKNWSFYKIPYNIPGYKWRIGANGFTKEAAIDMLLDNPRVANALFNTKEKIGLFVLKRDFYGSAFYELCIIIPHENDGLRTKTASTVTYKR